MYLKKFFNNYFGYSRRERSGSFVLFIILVIVIIIRLTNGGRSEPGGNEIMINTVASVKGADNNKIVQSHIVDSANNAIRKIIKRKPDSEKKEIKSSVKESAVSYAGTKKTTDYKKVDLNKSDSLDFMKLPGIGVVLSARIVKFRNLLGGYVSVSQLKEVYGLKDDVINLNMKYFECDSTDIVKLNINSATFSTLLRHPYINKEQVEAIFNYRRLAGSLSHQDDLLLNGIFSDNELERLAPYLSFEQD